MEGGAAKERWEKWAKVASGQRRTTHVVTASLVKTSQQVRKSEVRKPESRYIKMDELDALSDEISVMGTRRDNERRDMSECNTTFR
ncbi:hypothetical protein E4U21_004340 [Claviceps maximensis]|nr:hypothetical protein E4U21_004340 [Claviceps maximensis]